MSSNFSTAAQISKPLARNKKRSLDEGSNKSSSCASFSSSFSSRKPFRRQRHENDSLPFNINASSTNFQCFFNESFTYQKPTIMSTNSSQNITLSFSSSSEDTIGNNWSDFYNRTYNNSPSTCTSFYAINETKFSESNHALDLQGDHLNNIFRETEATNNENSRDDAHQFRCNLSAFRH